MCGRRARQQQEWEERQAERKARQAEMAGEPFDKEVTLPVLLNQGFAQPAETSKCEATSCLYESSCVHPGLNLLTAGLLFVSQSVL